VVQTYYSTRIVSESLGHHYKRPNIETFYSMRQPSKGNLKHP
jgi:hypothetical protein